MNHKDLNVNNETLKVLKSFLCLEKDAFKYPSVTFFKQQMH